jgi:hypothetical protein
MKTQSIKYTRKTITGVPLFMLDAKTGEILSGSFKKEKLKGRESRGMTDERKFDVDKKEEIDWILLCVHERFFYNIDKVHSAKLGSLHYDSENGYRYYIDGRTDNTHSEGYGIFLIFTSLEKANLALKKFILPKLIKEKTVKTNKLREEYMEGVDKLNDLETKLKEL